MLVSGVCVCLCVCVCVCKYTCISFNEQIRIQYTTIQYMYVHVHLICQQQQCIYCICTRVYWKHVKYNDSVCSIPCTYTLLLVWCILHVSIVTRCRHTCLGNVGLILSARTSPGISLPLYLRLEREREKREREREGYW